MMLLVMAPVTIVIHLQGENNEKVISKRRRLGFPSEKTPYFTKHVPFSEGIIIGMSKYR